MSRYLVYLVLLHTYSILCEVLHWYWVVVGSCVLRVLSGSLRILFGRHIYDRKLVVVISSQISGSGKLSRNSCNVKYFVDIVLLAIKCGEIISIEEEVVMVVVMTAAIYTDYPYSFSHGCYSWFLYSGFGLTTLGR
jgi:hypothetical protein